VLNRISRRAAGDDGTLTSLMDKFKTVFKIFFPDKPRPLTPKEMGRQRLQMILVADRCGLSPAALIEMKRNTFKALQVGRGAGRTSWGGAGGGCGGAVAGWRRRLRGAAAARGGWHRRWGAAARTKHRPMPLRSA
jgi:hypothetical protein